MLKRLAAYQRQNQLDFALRELGRIERTLFMLDWLELPRLRQMCQAGLNLVIAAIVCWNSTYLADAIDHLRRECHAVPAEPLAHTSPLTWEHIGFSGDFL